MNYLEMLRSMLANKMQQKFDPRYAELQAELFNMKNPNGPSDTRGQGLDQIMMSDPRWKHLMAQGARNDKMLNSSLFYPDTGASMNKEMMEHMLMRQLSKRNKIMAGGGI